MVMSALHWMLLRTLSSRRIDGEANVIIYCICSVSPAVVITQADTHSSGANYSRDTRSGNGKLS